MTQGRTFVGFGFGPIQSGLFLYEAFRTGRFSRFVVSEVDERVVAMMQHAGGTYSLNIAHPDRIQGVTIPGIELLNPRQPGDRARLLEAIAQADELATALPSVDFFTRGGPCSVVSLLSEALSEGALHPQLLYAAENNNHAAEILTEHLKQSLPAARLAQFQVLNTVVGKMSGVITDPEQIRTLGLAPLTPDSDRAVLVEAFNRILITQVNLGNFQPAIDAFIQKPDLLPFEEAKLFGHNAIHALIGYLAHERGLHHMSQVAEHPDILAIARNAFLNECGPALCRKYAPLRDPFFSPNGFLAYAEDLLVRMVNPNLQDLVARVIRDPQRKLAWDDRIFGTLRLVIGQGFNKPTNLACGAAAALRFHLAKPQLDRAEVTSALGAIWGEHASSPMAGQLIDCVLHS